MERSVIPMMHAMPQTLALMATLCLLPFGRAATPPPPGFLRVAVVQFRSGEDIRENIARMTEQIGAAADKGAQVVVFPECAVSSYFAEAVRRVTADDLRAAEEALRAACQAHGIAAVVGTPEFRADGIANSALIIGADGRVIARHHKVHLVDGDTDWDCVPGSAPPPVFRIGEARCSVVICHDSRFPELTRLPVLAGARVMFYISHESPVTKEAKLGPYRAQVQARAVENGVFFVHANAPADDAHKGSHGQSRIVAPDGNLISEASIFQEEMLVADLELTRADAAIAVKSLQAEPLADWWREGMRHVRVIE